MDAETNLTWTLEGDDAGDFTITKDPNSGHGLLRFRNVPNFEASVDNDMHNDYEVTVVVSDGSWRASRTLTVNVEDVNEHPTITTGATTKTIDENTTPVETYAADDVMPMTPNSGRSSPLTTVTCSRSTRTESSRSSARRT